MRRTIREHGRTAAFTTGLCVLALAITGYILDNQRVALPGWLPGGSEPYDRFEVQLPSAQAVTPGQGQQVLIRGVDVGDILGVDLEDGVAVARIRVLREHAGLIRRDVTALLRPKTPLNDMALELTPGRPDAPRLPAGATIPDANVATNVQLDELLASLDSDTQLALQLLLSGAGRGLDGDGRRLAGTLERLSPVQHNLRRINGALRDRDRDLARLVTLSKQVTETLAENRADVVRAVRSSDVALGASGRRAAELSAAIARLPGTLQATNEALDAGTALAREATPAAGALRPLASELTRSLVAGRPFFRATEPTLRRQLLPFARDTIDPLRKLRSLTRQANAANHDSDEVNAESRKALNMLAYDPPGDEKGFLFYQQWVNQNLPWVYATQDAHGPIRRIRLGYQCPTEQAAAREAAKVNPQLAFRQALQSDTAAAEDCPPTREAPDTTAVAPTDEPVFPPPPRGATLGAKGAGR